ncbi:alpha-beta hydrolase superfamily lysophospholipase [Rhodococcus sp. 27YEA15]|uniref:alpha/beta hydrolase n=1 Tax=Rhodococcus sp. 27YEA15 TaxID=3156259 RepID=UPI003C7CC46A
MQHEESSFTGRAGTRIVYDVWFPDVEPTGILVLCHGLGEHARRYDHVVAALGELGLIVYAPDHRGHGRSGGKRVHLKEFSDFTDDLGALFAIIDGAHPGRRKFLLGHSMGGAIALSYAIDHQSDLTALALSGPAVIIATDKPKPIIQLGKFVGKYLPDLPVDNLDSAAVSRDQRVVDTYNADPLIHHGKVPAGIARGLITAAESFPARLPSLTIPVLLQHGSADQLTDPAGSKLVADLASSTDVTLKVYDGLYHEIFNEPEQKRVIEDLVDWLRPRVAGA